MRPFKNNGVSSAEKCRKIHLSAGEAKRRKTKNGAKPLKNTPSGIFLRDSAPTRAKLTHLLRCGRNTLVYRLYPAFVLVYHVGVYLSTVLTKIFSKFFTDTKGEGSASPQADAPLLYYAFLNG